MANAPNLPTLSFPSIIQHRLSRALLPSFLLPRDVPGRAIEVRCTAWLDGLRGWASLIVFLYHFSYSFHEWVGPGYGVDAKNHRVLQLPILRLFAAGPAMVCLFFAVSGYALSWAPMKQLHDGNAGKALSSIASSTFRRPIRLFLPPLAASLMVLVCIRLGLYTDGDVHHDGWARFGFWREARPPIKVSMGAQVGHYYNATARLVDVFSFEEYMDYPYDCHLWTVPVELRYSFVLFGVMAALSVARRSWRLVLTAALWVYCFWQGAWEAALFVGGLILALVSLLRGHGEQSFLGDELPIVESGEKHGQIESRKQGGMILLFIVGLYLASAPEWKPEATPGYVMLYAHLTPYWWLHHRVHFLYLSGAFAIIHSVSESPLLQSFFHNAPSRYFGRISFGLYLVHGPVCHMLGYALIPRLWAYTNGPVQAPLGQRAAGLVLTAEQRVSEARRKYEGGSAVGFEVGFLLGGMVVVPVTIWAADLFTRYVDEPVVRLARRIEVAVGPER